MSPAGFRWFVCLVVVALVAVMLAVVRGNAAWPSLAPDVDAARRHGDSRPAHPHHVLIPPAGVPYIDAG